MSSELQRTSESGASGTETNHNKSSSRGFITNVTKGTRLATRCRICRNVFTRGLGLMFAKKLTPTVLAFSKEGEASIHTFFVKHYLDVLFLNEQREVIELVEGLRPKSFYRPEKNAMFVIELPEGAIAKSKTRIGDIINFK